MQTLGGRLKHLRGDKTQGVFARELGLKQPYYSMLERNICFPHPRTINAICAKNGIRPAWLVYGEEPIYHEHVVAESSSAYTSSCKIQVVGTASANTKASIEWETLEHESANLGHAVAIRVNDDSMEPLARSGQLVIAIPDVDLRDEDLAVIQIRNKGVFFKRVFFHPDNMIELQSANPLRPQSTLFIRRMDILKQYRVIGVIFE